MLFVSVTDWPPALAMLTDLIVTCRDSAESDGASFMKMARLSLPPLGGGGVGANFEPQPTAKTAAPIVFRPWSKQLNCSVRDRRSGREA